MFVFMLVSNSLGVCVCVCVYVGICGCMCVSVSECLYVEHCMVAASAKNEVTQYNK